MIWLLTGVLVVTLIITSMRTALWFCSRGTYNTD